MDGECTEACRAIVHCVVCGKRKGPRGRSVPLPAANGYCDWDCRGYGAPPLPGHLWPGERLPNEPEPEGDE